MKLISSYLLWNTHIAVLCVMLWSSPFPLDQVWVVLSQWITDQTLPGVERVKKNRQRELLTSKLPKENKPVTVRGSRARSGRRDMMHPGPGMPQERGPSAGLCYPPGAGQLFHLHRKAFGNYRAAGAITHAEQQRIPAKAWTLVNREGKPSEDAGGNTGNTNISEKIQGHA